MTINKPGRLATARNGSGPERSSPRRLGNGLLIRAQGVRLLPGPPPRHTTRLTCGLRRICRGGPAVHGLRRVRFPCRSPIPLTHP